jgi:pimeloyl-ACP methyl ester carboxylesterase
MSTVNQPTQNRAAMNVLAYGGLRARCGYATEAKRLPTPAIAQQSGSAILVGHSYGGAVICQAGTDPKVKGMVFIAAFAPDKGESVQSLIGPPTPGGPPILPRQNGFLFLDRANFAAGPASDGEAGGWHGGGDQGQPCDLRVAATGRDQAARGRSQNRRVTR